jgi:hypothetical protein
MHKHIHIHIHIRTHSYIHSHTHAHTTYKAHVSVGGVDLRWYMHPSCDKQMEMEDSFPLLAAKSPFSLSQGNLGLLGAGKHAPTTGHGIPRSLTLSASINLERDRVTYTWESHIGKFGQDKKRDFLVSAFTPPSRWSAKARHMVFAPLGNFCSSGMQLLTDDKSRRTRRMLRQHYSSRWSVKVVRSLSIGQEFSQVQNFQLAQFKRRFCTAQRRRPMRTPVCEKAMQMHAWCELASTNQACSKMWRKTKIVGILVMKWNAVQILYPQCWQITVHDNLQHFCNFIHLEVRTDGSDYKLRACKFPICYKDKI